MEPGSASHPLAQLRRGVLEYCVLALLSTEELYSVELVHRLGTGSGLVVSEGTLYPLLSRLRREGRVVTSWRESSSGPPRRYYALTEAGGNALAAFTTDWRAFTTAVDALLSTGEHHDDDQR
jgi:PadR family transcriptional regulator, regulatory protein PadR